MARRNNDEHEDTATVRIPVRPPVAPPARGYTPLRPGPLPKGRDRRETVPITKSNGAYERIEALRKKVIAAAAEMLAAGETPTIAALAAAAGTTGGWILSNMGPNALQNILADARKMKRNPAKTYAQARAELLAALRAQGWELSSPTLKIPHATDPSGEIRLWFKPQAVHFTRVTGRGRHEFGNARAIYYDLDIRALSPDEFLAQVMGRFARENPCYTGPQVATSQGHVHTVKCNPAHPAHCEHVAAPNGAELLFCVEKKKFGYAGWLYDAIATSGGRVPVSLGGAQSLEDAVANGRRFLREQGFRVVRDQRSNPSFAGLRDIDPAHPMRAIQYLKKLGLSESQAQTAFERMAAVEQHGGVPRKPLQYIADAIDAWAVESKEVADHEATYVKFKGIDGHLRPTVIYDNEYASYVLSSLGDFEELKERLKEGEVRQKKTVYLDNQHESESVTAYVTGRGACEWAKNDQSIDGDRWECSDDDFAYAILVDRPSLYQDLVDQGYDVDATEYSAPEEEEAEEYDEDE